MLRAIRYARKSGTPYFGICLGMQTACIEFARDVCGLRDADSTEFNADTPFPIIFKLRDLVGVDELGGTMRLGAWQCELKEGSLVREIYHNSPEISERTIARTNQRNSRAVLEKEDFVSAAFRPTGNLFEMIELPREIHPFSSPVKFHPEYKSKPLNAHPIFVSFVKAAHENRLKSENLKDA